MPRPNEQLSGRFPNNPEEYEVSARALSQGWGRRHPHRAVHTEDEPEVQSPGRGAGNTPTPGWPVVTAVLSLLEAPEGNLRERVSGSRPTVCLNSLPAVRARESPRTEPLRMGAEERVAKGPP